MSFTSSNTGGTVFDREALLSLSLDELNVLVGLTDNGLSQNEVYFGDGTIVAGLGPLGGLATAVVVVGLDLQQNDTAFGGDGNDQLLGMAGSDTLDGGTGDDLIYGYTGPINNGTSLINVSLSLTLGPDGNDSLMGSAGNDTIVGGDGNDTVEGGIDADSMSGGANGGDVLSYANSAEPVTVILGNGTGTGGDAQGDTFAGFAHLVGSAGADSLGGDAGANRIEGGGGADTFRADAGNDTLDGGSGADRLDYSAAPGPVSVNLDAGAAQDGYGGTDSIVGFETIALTGGADTLVSGAGEQDIDVGGGSDSITWQDGDGDDTIRLGTGSDTLDLQGWTGTGTDPWDTQAGTGGATLFVNSAPGGDGPDTLWVYGYDPSNDTITCFAEGTMILTAHGEVPVERLRAGDLVVSMQDGAKPQPLVWVGHTRVDLGRARNPRAAAPILIRAGALAAGMPCRDLRVSPEHAVHLDGRLVPARLLVNGSSIVQELWRRAVTYYHLELAAHGLLVSDGAVTESYLDDGNRSLFDNAAIAALVVDFEAHRGNGRYAEAACAPLLLEGPALDAIRLRIAARAGGLDRAA